jgi:predicted transposase YbfD/YdcC
MKYADIDMNISTQALLVLRALSRQEIPDDWGVMPLETSAWYNGQERGVCVTFRHSSGKRLAITFGECRNSDAIFIDHFDIKWMLNPPTIADFSEEAYKKRRYANYLDISHAIDIITDTLRDWADKVSA